LEQSNFQFFTFSRSTVQENIAVDDAFVLRFFLKQAKNHLKKNAVVASACRFGC